jgi:pimeloyl-ACP methyl ester carboxylesterase
VAHFLLIHGAGHGGWCWDQVSALLRAQGHEAASPDLPCEELDAGLDDYADVALASLGTHAEDVVVVAHSLGALVAPLVAQRVRTRRIVFVAGIIGAPGRSLAELADEDAERDLPIGEDDLESDDAGRFRFTAKGARELLYHDCDPQLAEAAAARLRYQRSMWHEVAKFDSWPDTEIFSITCLDDRMVNPAWSDHVARARLNVTPVHLYGGHSPFLSRPGELTDIITAGMR